MSSPELFNVEQSEKQSRWDEAAKRIEKTIERLGLHIDEGIKEGVIALNVLDINTDASCEGHLDRGTGAPWIDVSAKLPEELSKRWRELSDKAKGGEELKAVAAEAERKNLEEQKKLFP